MMSNGKKEGRREGEKWKRKRKMEGRRRRRRRRRQRTGPQWRQRVMRVSTARKIHTHSNNA
jgi:hypothetical protein